MAPPTLPQGGETTRLGEREQDRERAKERERALGWVGLTIDRKRKDIQGMTGTKGEMTTRHELGKAKSGLNR